MTHYDQLGLPMNASPDDVRQAYRRLAKRMHPDSDSGDAKAMVRLNLAYETLRDQNRREAYDASLKPGKKLPPRPVRKASSVDPQAFVATVFRPVDATLRRSLDRLDAAIEELAYDLYDDAAIAAFDLAVEAARKASHEAAVTLGRADCPEACVTPLGLYRQGLRHLDDALGDFGDFSLNFDTDLLVFGREILATGRDLLAATRDVLNRL